MEEQDLPPAVRRPGRAGLFTPHDGGVHPARWLRALAAGAEQRGARICEQTRVLAVDEGVVRSDRGAVRCEHVVVAVDALAALLPASGVRTRRLNMVATAPEPTRRLPFPVYARDGHEMPSNCRAGR